jgi:hypothetical protein
LTRFEKPKIDKIRRVLKTKEDAIGQLKEELKLSKAKRVETEKMILELNEAVSTQNSSGQVQYTGGNINRSSDRAHSYYSR